MHSDVTHGRGPDGAYDGDPGIGQLAYAGLTIGDQTISRGGGLDAAPVVDPATQEIVGWAPIADEPTVAAAVSAAAKAFGPWADLPATARSSHLAAIADWIRGARASAFEGTYPRTGEAAERSFERSKCGR